MQSTELTQFYQAYLEWLETGCPPHPVFFKGFGLCRCLVDFMIGVHSYSRESAVIVFKRELQQQFQEAGLDYLFPFNNGSRVAYIDESEELLTHANPQRIQWVKEHATP
jgi:hypothetical protein